MEDTTTMEALTIAKAHLAKLKQSLLVLVSGTLITKAWELPMFKQT